MSYRRFRTYTCGSVRNTLGPIDQNYLEPNRLKYNLNLINTTTTSNDFIFDPQYDQNFMNVAGYDKRPNIIYQKFALDNQFSNSSITNINLSFGLERYLQRYYSPKTYQFLEYLLSIKMVIVGWLIHQWYK